MFKFSVVLSLLLALSMVFPQAVLGVDTPNFPACVTATGTVIASYDSGTHGIVGDSGTYTGSDKVYKITDTTLVQCFCSTNGSGIQTNWWKTSSLTQEQFKQLEADGWIYVPNGAAWGLEDTSYMAKNSNYSCNGGGDVCTNLEGTQTSIPDGYHAGLTPNTCMKYEFGGPPQSSGIGGGQVLGLATTGTTSRMLAFGLLGSIVLALGLIGNSKQKGSNVK